MSRKRSTRQKLFGWGILLAAAVVIGALFLVTRSLQPSAPAGATTAVADASKTSAAATSEPAAPAAPTSSSQAASASSSAVSASSQATSPTASSPQGASASSQAPSAAASDQTSSAQEAALADAAAMDQQSRKAMLLKLIDQGVFTGVQAIGSPPKVGVTPLFQGLDPQLQKQFVALVFAYVNNGAKGTEALQLVDARTGNTTGTYTTETGLKLL